MYTVITVGFMSLWNTGQGNLGIERASFQTLKSHSHVKKTTRTM